MIETEHAILQHVVVMHISVVWDWIMYLRCISIQKLAKQETFIRVESHVWFSLYWQYTFAFSGMLFISTWRFHVRHELIIMASSC